MDWVMTWGIEKWGILVTALTTVTLAFINWSLLKKYDKQHKIDIFYHSFPYRKKLKDEISKLFETYFSSPLNRLPSRRWNYSGKSMSKSQILAKENAKEYKEILSKLKDASRAFPKQGEETENFIALLKNLDDAIRLHNWKQNDEEHQGKLKDAYGEVYKNTKFIESLEKHLKFPTD